MVKGGVPVWYAKVSRRKEESMGHRIIPETSRSLTV
jgi:hypothetical protein